MINRCDHCGKFATQKHMALYTLYDMARGHAHEEDVAVCLECSKRYDADHWQAWLDSRFATIDHDAITAEAMRYYSLDDLYADFLPGGTYTVTVDSSGRVISTPPF